MATVPEAATIRADAVREDIIPADTVLADIQEDVFNAAEQIAYPLNKN